MQEAAYLLSQYIFVRYAQLPLTDFGTKPIVTSLHSLVHIRLSDGLVVAVHSMFPKVQGTRTTEETHMTLYLSFLTSLLFALGTIEFGAHVVQDVSPATLTCGLVGMFP